MLTDASQVSYEPILSAYKVGGLSLGLVVAGFLILSVGTGLDVGLNISPAVNPGFVLLAGVAVVISGAFLGFAESNQRNRVQLAIVDSLMRLIEGAAKVAKEGAGYDAALDKTLAKFPAVVQEFAKMMGEPGK